MATNKKTAARPSTKGASFTEKYGVDDARIYKGDSDNLKIPPKGHPLFDSTSPTEFDPLIVAEIDKDGKMTTPIEVWTDADTGTLWVVDGRSRLLAVREVNRLRAKDGREEVKPLIVAFAGSEQEAATRLHVKNHHRRLPTPSQYAIGIRELRKLGWPWADCAVKLHYTEGEPEGWCKRTLPLAFCIEEVQDAVDTGKLRQSVATKFGGRALDGSEALSRKDQLELLKEMTAQKERGESAAGPKPVLPKVRARLRTALAAETDESSKLVLATLAFVDGDTSALKDYPNIGKLVIEALMPVAKEKPAKAPKEPKAAKPAKEPKAPKEKKVKKATSESQTEGAQA